MMEGLVALSLLLVTCYAGTPGHQTLVANDAGCILMRQPNFPRLTLCARGRTTKISPGADNMYRMTILSGFPLFRPKDPYSIPRYKQEYTWWEDHDRVSIDVNNCLRVQPFLFITVDTIGPCPPRENTDKESVPNPYYYENGQNYDDAPPDPTSDPSSGPPSISPIPQPFPNNELKQGLLDTQEPFALSLQDTPPPYLVEEGESLNPGLDPSLMNSSEDIFASNEDPLLFNGIEAFDASLDPSSISNVLGDESSPFTLAEAEPLNADISLDTNVFN